MCGSKVGDNIFVFLRSVMTSMKYNPFAFRYDSEGLISSYIIALRWRHNWRDNVSNHQPHDCLLNRLFRRRSKKTSKLRVTGLCAGNSPGPVNSPHKGPVTRKMFPFDDVIMMHIWHIVISHMKCSNAWDDRYCVYMNRTFITAMRSHFFRRPNANVLYELDCFLFW